MEVSTEALDTVSEGSVHGTQRPPSRNGRDVQVSTAFVFRYLERPANNARPVRLETGVTKLFGGGQATVLRHVPLPNADGGIGGGNGGAVIFRRRHRGRGSHSICRSVPTGSATQKNRSTLINGGKRQHFATASVPEKRGLRGSTWLRCNQILPLISSASNTRAPQHSIGRLRPASNSRARSQCRTARRSPARPPGRGSPATWPRWRRRRRPTARAGTASWR